MPEGGGGAAGFGTYLCIMVGGGVSVCVCVCERCLDAVCQGDVHENRGVSKRHSRIDEVAGRLTVQDKVLSERPNA
jgi:hypothetical protein